MRPNSRETKWLMWMARTCGANIRKSATVHGVSVFPVGAPSPPLTGWESVTEANHKEYADKIPQVTAGLNGNDISFASD